MPQLKHPIVAVYTPSFVHVHYSSDLNLMHTVRTTVARVTSSYLHTYASLSLLSLERLASCTISTIHFIHQIDSIVSKQIHASRTTASQICLQTISSYASSVHTIIASQYNHSSNGTQTLKFICISILRKNHCNFPSHFHPPSPHFRAPSALLHSKCCNAFYDTCSKSVKLTTKQQVCYNAHGISGTTNIFPRGVFVSD